MAKARPARPVVPRHGRPRVRWVGSQFGFHSLSYANREICRRLLTAGTIELEAHDVDPAEPSVLEDSRLDRLAAVTTSNPRPRRVDVTVRHRWPADWTPPEQGRWVVAQPWEFGALPESWVAPLRDEVDEVWCYTTWQRDTYVACGVPAEKIQVIPLGVDHELFAPDGPMYPVGGDRSFRFLFVGGTIPRKGIDALLVAYHRAFTDADDVSLVIKGSQLGAFYAGSSLHEELTRLRAEQPRMAPIEYIDADLDHADVAALYRACDALVHPCRGEAFGLPVAEAMASELPVIVTGAGAPLDFCDDETAFLVPARVEHFDPGDRLPPPCEPGYWWAEPDPVALAELMRRVYEDRDEAKRRARLGREAVTTMLSWDRTADLVKERLVAVASGPGEALGAPFSARPLASPEARCHGSRPPRMDRSTAPFPRRPSCSSPRTKPRHSRQRSSRWWSTSRRSTTRSSSSTSGRMTARTCSFASSRATS